MFYGKGNSEWKICESIPQGLLSNDGGLRLPHHYSSVQKISAP